jgi:hypothetical protein
MCVTKDNRFLFTAGGDSIIFKFIVKSGALVQIIYGQWNVWIQSIFLTADDQKLFAFNGIDEGRVFWFNGGTTGYEDFWVDGKFGAMEKIEKVGTSLESTSGDKNGIYFRLESFGSISMGLSSGKGQRGTRSIRDLGAISAAVDMTSDGKFLIIAGSSGLFRKLLLVDWPELGWDLILQENDTRKCKDALGDTEIPRKILFNLDYLELCDK